MKKHYNTLGLNQGASQEEIQTAYERLSNELDPKKNDHQEFFIEEYKKVQEAYKALYNSSILATEKGAKNTNVKPKAVAKKKHLSNTKNTIPSKSRSKKNYGIAALLLVLLLFFVYTLLQPQKYKIDEVVFNNDIAYLKHDMTLLNGKVTDPLYNGLFVNVVKEGFCRRWYVYGQLKEEGNFKNNRYHGNWNFYHKNGNKKASGVFNENGGKSKGNTGIPDTNREGLWRFWHENGQLRQEGNYVNGQREGLWRQWHENGQLELRGDCVNGKQEGLVLEWDENGNLIKEYNFVNGVNQNIKNY